MKRTRLAFVDSPVRYGFRQISERRQLPVWRKRFPNQLYKSAYSFCLCFPSVFWLANVSVLTA